MWRHVLTHRVIIRPILEPYLRYIEESAHLGIPKYLQLSENVDTNDVGITTVMFTLKIVHVFS